MQPERDVSTLLSISKLETDTHGIHIYGGLEPYKSEGSPPRHIDNDYS